MMDVNFIAELENLFRTNFLKSAPLYLASSVFRLPYEDIKRIVTAYRGSLTEVTRPVEEIADYELSKPREGFHPDWARYTISKLGQEAGAVIDGLIRLENVRNHPSHDPRNTADMRVVDIFDHADGRRNLQIMAVDYPSSSDPNATMPGWVGYRFYFAAATISSEYRKIATP